MPTACRWSEGPIAIPPPERVDIAIIGGGAAGLMAAISAGVAAEAHRPAMRIVVFDGARKLGAKILVAGGGRCNVTHDRVDESAYAGSTRPAIRKVLGRFDASRTVAFFSALGVELKREETGKLFPVTDDARTVLDALLKAAAGSGVQLRHPWRVAGVETTEIDGGRWFLVRRQPGEGAAPEEVICARRVILATGGMALPKSGSDGAGYTIARSLGHSTTARIFPALVPLILAEGCFIRALSGLTLPSTLTVLSGAGKRLASFTGSTLLTHFGLSGPSALDVSRYYLDSRHQDPGTRLMINWLPGTTNEQVDADLVSLRTSPARWLTEPPRSLPERLARALCEQAGVDPLARPDHLSRDKRRALAAALTAMPLPVTGDRGFTHAEVTAGGVPLSELHLDTMESRACPGLHIIGEVCDVDGRIGGFNFQWAWASGHVAGSAAAADLLRRPG